MTRRRRAEARRRKKEKEEMSNFPSRKKWAMPGARYPGTVLAAREVRTWRMQTTRRAVARAGLLRRSEDRHLVTTPLPIPVTVASALLSQ